MSQACALVHRLWLHPRAVATLSQQVELLKVVSSVLYALGTRTAVPDARGCIIALGVMRSCLSALVCLLALAQARPRADAAAGIISGRSMLLITLHVLDDEVQACTTHALCELAGLRRVTPAPPPRFTLPEGYVLVSEAALSAATPAQRSELRGMARQVLAALASHAGDSAAGAGAVAGADV